MNLEDYAYEDDGRWYVNPQVSLDEQNAFINNFRGTQAQNNAEIESQTRNLGTQAPSQLGGLSGGSGYFKSRYQTPQTNQTIADLRAVAQASALQSALSNEVSKAQKRYRDAYRAASERETNKDNTDDASPLYNNLDSNLKVNETGTVSEEPITPNEDVVNDYEVAVDDNGIMYYQDFAGRKFMLSVPSIAEGWAISTHGAYSVIPPEEGEGITVNNKHYRYMGGRWYRVDGLYDENYSNYIGNLKQEARGNSE